MSRHHRTAIFTIGLTATLLSFRPLSGNTQVNKIAGVVTMNKITLTGPGFSHEHRIRKNQTIQLTALINPLIQATFSSSFSHVDFYLDPAFKVGYRYYYNLSKRADKEKRTAMNSGNYISAYTGVTYTRIRLHSSHFTENNARPVGMFGAAWGIQRNYAKHFSVDVNAGLQYRFGRSSLDPFSLGPIQEVTGTIIPAGSLTIGFWLN